MQFEKKQLRVHVRYGSETGTAEDISQDIAERLTDEGVCVESYGTLDDCDLAKLPMQAFAGHIFVFVVATCGDGETPRNMRSFWSFFCRSNLPSRVLSDMRMRFAVFGLGDRAYIKFNAAARRLYTRFLQLGAENIVPIGLGDESANRGHDEQLIPWLQQLVSAIGSTADHLFMEKGTKSSGLNMRPPRFDVEIESRDVFEDDSCIESDLRTSPDLWQKGDALLATADTTLSVNEVITNSAFACVDREVRHIELDTTCSSNSDVFSHKAGDVLHVLPRNRPSAVDAFLALMGLNGDDIIDVQLSTAATGSGGRRTAFGDVQINIRTPCCLRAFVSAQFDLWGLPRRRFLSQLASFATDNSQRMRLEELASADGSDDFTQYVHRENRTILMVLRDFPSARPPTDALVNMMPRIRPRAYSVASSSEGFSGRVHLCVAMVRYETSLRYLRVGLVSSFFERLEYGDVVPVFLERASALRFMPDMPALLIGPGTGVAPMRAFLSECRANGVHRSLFFGCRHERGDFLYKEYWIRWKQEGVLTNLCTAFSRMGPEKVYVQHQLKEKGKAVWELIDVGKGLIYLAGAAGDMPKAVRLAVVEICKSHGGLDEVAAKTYVNNLETQGRFQVECW